MKVSSLKAAFFFFFSFQVCFAQEVSIVASPMLESENLLYDWNVVDKNEKEITLIEYRAIYPGFPVQFYLKKLNSNTLQVISEKMIFKFDNNSYKKWVKVGDMLVFFFTRFEKPNNTLCYKKFDLKGIEIGEGTISEVIKPNSKTGFIDAEYYFLQKNSESLSVFVHNKESETQESMFFNFFDSKLNTTKTGKVKMPSKYNKRKIEQLFTDYENDVYFLESDEEIDVNKFQITYHYKPVYFVHTNLTTSKTVFNPLEFELNKVWSAKFGLTSKNEIIGFGLYSDEDKTKELTARGAMSFKYDPMAGKLEIKDKKLLPFEVVETMEDTKTAKKGKGIWNEILTRDIIEDKTNNGYMVGVEKYYTYKMNDGSFWNEYFRVSELLICFIDQDLKINSFYPHKRASYPPATNTPLRTQPLYRVFFSGEKKCILADDDRYASNTTIEPKGAKGASVLVFSKDNALLSRKTIPFHQDEKKNIYYQHSPSAIKLSDNEWFYYSDFYKKDDATNYLRPKEIEKKFLKISFK